MISQNRSECLRHSVSVVAVTIVLLVMVVVVVVFIAFIMQKHSIFNTISCEYQIFYSERFCNCNGIIHSLLSIVYDIMCIPSQSPHTYLISDKCCLHFAFDSFETTFEESLSRSQTFSKSADTFRIGVLFSIFNAFALVLSLSVSFPFSSSTYSSQFSFSFVHFRNIHKT